MAAGGTSRSKAILLLAAVISPLNDPHALVRANLRLLTAWVTAHGLHKH